MREAAHGVAVCRTGLLISGLPFPALPAANPPEGRVEDFDSLKAFSAFDSDLAFGRVFVLVFALVFVCDDFSVISLLNDENIKSKKNLRHLLKFTFLYFKISHWFVPIEHFRKYKLFSSILVLKA